MFGLDAVREIAGMPFVGLRTHTLPASRARFKRSIELLGLVLTLPVTVPLLVLGAAYVRAVAGPPVLFWQERLGLEELPQLWNVLRGEISVVGPRPERPELTAEHEELIPGYFRRHETPRHHRVRADPWALPAPLREGWSGLA